MVLFQMENGSLSDFKKSIYYLLIVQTEVCPLSTYLRSNKQKLSVCKWTKQTKQTKQTKRTKRTYPSMAINIHKETIFSCWKQSLQNKIMLLPVKA